MKKERQVHVIARKLPILFSDKATLSILGKIGYLSDAHYDFKVDSKNDFSLEIAVKAEKKWVIILERSHYFESVKDYLIGDTRDLRKVLKNHSVIYPYQGQMFHRIKRVSESTHRVTSWVIKQEVIDQMISHPIWLVPESACLERLSKIGVAALTLNDTVLYITETSNGLISSRGTKEDFLRIAGVEREYSDVPKEGSLRKEVTPLAGGDAIATVLMGLVDIFKTQPLLFFFAGMGGSDVGNYPWLGAFKRFAAVFLVYLLVTSAYLFIANSLLDSELDNLSPDAESSLSISKDISVLNSQAVEIQDIFDEDLVPWVAWDVMIDLLSAEVNVIAVNANPPEVTFTAVAPRATDVLVMLASDPRIEEAKFARPVRKDRGQDLFSITARFLPHDPDVTSGAAMDFAEVEASRAADVRFDKSE